MSTAAVDDSKFVTNEKRGGKRTFSTAMVLGTFTPLLVLPLLFGPIFDTVTVAYEAQVALLVLLFARGHAGLSLLMYFDTTFQRTVRENKLRFIFIPLALVAILPITMANNRALFEVAFAVLFFWNLWHFNKQNSGVCALVSVAEGRRPPDKTAKSYLNAACIFAIIGHYPSLELGNHAPAWLHAPLMQLGDWAVIPFMAVVVASMWNLLQKRAEHNFYTASMYLMSLTMFGMVFVGTALYPGNLFFISMGYGTAHAIQYTIIMCLMAGSAGNTGQFMLSRNDQRKGSTAITRAIIGSCALLAVLGWGIYRFNADSIMGQIDKHFGIDILLTWIPASVVALLYVHFIVDAGAFKLSRKTQREWMQSRMSFLFQR